MPRLPTPGWGAGSRHLPFPVKDVRTVVDGDVLTFAGFEIEVVHAGSHTWQRVLPDGRDPALGGPRVRRRDRPERLPQLVAGRHGALRTGSSTRIEPTCSRAMVEDHRRARARAQPIPAGTLSGAQPPRGTDDLLPPVSDAMLGLYRPPTGPRVCTGSATSRPRRSSTRSCSPGRPERPRRRDQGDVHVRGQGREIAHAASRTDGEHRPRLPRERPRPPDAVQGLPRVPAVPFDRASGSAARVPAVRDRDDRGRRRRRGRRGDRGGRPVPAWSRALEGRAPRELDRRRRMPSGLPREADRVPRTARAELDEDCRTRLRTNPLRCSTARSTARRRSCSAPRSSPTICVSRAPSTSRRPQRTRRRRDRVRARPAWSGGWTTTRARRSSSNRGRSRRRRRALGGGGRYDGLAEVLGGPPARDRVRARSGSDPYRPPRGRRGAPRRARGRMLRRLDRSGSRGGRGRLVDDLRDAGIPAAIAFEDRPLKAQLRMADRSGAAYAAIVGERGRSLDRDLETPFGRRAGTGSDRRCGELALSDGLGCRAMSGRTT